MQYFACVFRIKYSLYNGPIAVNLTQTPDGKAVERNLHEAFTIAFLTVEALYDACIRSGIDPQAVKAIEDAGLAVATVPNQMRSVGFVEFSPRQLESFGFKTLASLARSLGES